MNDSSSDDAVSISYDADAETYRARFDPESIAPSMAVVEAMASICNASPTELEPLIDTVDPLAIDQLVSGADDDEDRALEFHYLDHAVTVSGHGVVEIRPLPAE